MRSSGLLLPIASLPDGRLGDEAFRFVEFLAEAGQRWWQVLPLGPPGTGGSPYAAKSAFAGNEEWVEAGGAATKAFCGRNAFWLGDYCRYREDPACADRQFAFERAWMALKRYASERGVGLIGDVPFFLARDSADVWAHPGVFRQKVQAGVPPDCYSETGQLWGSPHYTWASFRWWIERLRHAFRYFDIVRLDHFLGFSRAWEVSVRARTAKRGRWTPGPGARFFVAVRKELGRKPMIAEDLGLVTPQAIALRKRFGLPGMKVLQFCFGEDDSARPHRFERDCVVYTGTHDNDTTVGWYRKAGPEGARARRYAGCRAADIHWGLIRVAHQSVADTAIVPVQDLLGLGSSARVNTPGTTRGNWRWRLERGQLRAAIARKLRRITEDAGR